MLRTLVFFSLLHFTVASQTDSVYVGRDPQKGPPERPKVRNDAWKESVTYGGNFQMWFGNPTFVFLSPTVGFIPYENFNIGIGGIYNYISLDNGIYGKFSQSIFGGHSYFRYIIATNYFVQTQFDKLYQPDFYSYIPGRKVWVNYWLAGGGLRRELGNKAAIITSIMYNLTPSLLSIYPSRLVVQFGFVAGF
jgi:hypothetical protein